MGPVVTAGLFTFELRTSMWASLIRRSSTSSSSNISPISRNQRFYRDFYKLLRIIDYFFNSPRKKFTLTTP